MLENYAIQEIMNRTQEKSWQKRGQIMEDFECQEYPNSLGQYFPKYRIDTRQEIILGDTIFIALRNI